METLKPRRSVKPSGWGLALALLLIASVASAGAPLGDELLAPAAPRPGPRSRPEVLAQPAVYTARSVLYAARSSDGAWLATVESGENGNELWLHPLGSTTELPRLLRESPVRLAAPALSSDGRLLAFVDHRDDVKGDVWLLDLSRPNPELRRLTGAEGADDAPVFTPDCTALVYHRQRPGFEQRELVKLVLSTGRSEVLPIKIDAAFASPSPDGLSWVLVSRQADPGGDLWLWEAESGSLRQLTAGPERDLYPVWEGPETILLTRFAALGKDSLDAPVDGQILRLELERSTAEGFPVAFPLTATTQGAIAPLPAGERFFFVAGPGSGGQLLSLPSSGEIPDQADVAAQWQLAQLFLERQPPDPAHARLACARVLAQETEPTQQGAWAALALAGLLETAKELPQAESAYEATARRYRTFPREAALAEVARLRLQAGRRCSEVVVASRRQTVLREAKAAMLLAAQGGGDDAMARALLDTARLRADYGDGAADLLSAIKDCEKVATLPAVSRPLQAEAAVQRAILLVRIAQGEGAQAALVAVARDFGDQEVWAEAAIAALLDQVTAPGKGDPASQSRALAALAERYRTILPRLAMGAWNRSGDLAWRDHEWAKAKDAYRTVLEQFAPLPTPTAAARFALAEVLYREERFSEATALYETEMAAQPEDDPLYQLARAAYIRKSLAAGEQLYRVGELAAARALFLDLIRYDGRSVEAHRGYIKSVAAQGQAEELLALYHKLLQNYPDDPILLYATGLCETYLSGQAHLKSADQLLSRAAERMPDSEYPPQTRGYLAEVSETVYGEPGGLERALQFYRRAWLLNRSQEHPENRANLDLNIGNVAFLLGRNDTAWRHYRQRLYANVPFDNVETELLFHQRYAAAAFQLGEKAASVAGYSKALQMIEARLNPGLPLERFGRLSRRVIERLFTPLLAGAAAGKALAEQQALSVELDRLGAQPPEAPPAAGWESFDQALRKLLVQEQRLLAGATDWNREAATEHGVELQALLTSVEKSLDEVPRLVETQAEINDRLGLAQLEAEYFAPAREAFESAFRLNQGLGHTGNLAANRRSAGVAAYYESTTVSGTARRALLVIARDHFTQALELIKRYPPQPKSAPSRSGGLIRIGTEVAFDQGGATAAAFGFSAAQEQRLAEVFLARIATELGEPAQAARLLRSQLERYPAANHKLAPRDLYGVGLLSHRLAQVDYALGEQSAALELFRRSTLISLQAENPVSAMLNLVNWGELLTQAEPQPALDDFLLRAAETTRLATGFRSSLPELVLPRYHNDLATLLVRLASRQPEDGSREALLYAALEHWQRALTLLETGEPGRELLHLRAAMQLNRGVVLAGLGLTDAAALAQSQALEAAQLARSSALEWRALAALGRFDEALALLERLAPTAFDLRRGELQKRFAPDLAQLANTDGEKSFALLERLSELERVQLLGRGALGLDDPATTEALRLAAPHLAERDRLHHLLVKAPLAEQDYLRLRLQQEQILIDTQLGQKLERLPPFYEQGGAGVVRLAAAATVLAVATDQERPAQQRFVEVQSAFLAECRAGKGGRFCGLLTPQPVEAIDVLEQLVSRTLLRFTPLDGERWLLFTLGGKSGITVETVTTATLNARLSATPAVLAAYEAPERFASAPVMSWGLSATQLLRAIAARKPFRQQVLDLGNAWPTGAPFVKLPIEQWTTRLADAHTLVLPGRAGLLTDAPNLPASGAQAAPLWEDERGARQPFSTFSAAESLALVVAPQAGIAQAYSLGQLLALQGVPSILLGPGSKGTLQPFVTAYATQSASAARAQLPPGWLLLGDGGPTAQEAAALGKRQFNDYGKAGVLAHNDHRYAQALALFESALAITETNPELAKFRTSLHRYARESAFAAGDLPRALLHAEALVQGIAKEKAYSAEHGDALLRLGLLQGRVEHFSAATASLQEATAIFADLGMAKEQAAALADFGVVMENAVDYPAARTHFEEAAGLRRTLKDEVALADQYRNLGRIYDLRLNQYAVAERYYAQAGELYARNQNTTLEAETLLEQGRCARLLGNFSAADARYREALAKLGPQELRTRMRIVLEQANNAWFQGRYQEAFDLRAQVEKHALAEGWPLEQVLVKNTGGLIWWTLGDHNRALLELRGALERAKQLEVRRDEVATTLNNIGLVQRESGDLQGALKTLEQALAIDRQLGSRWAIAYDLRNLAQTRLKLGEASVAMQQLDEAAILAQEIGDQVNLAKILLARGDAATRLNRLSEARDSYAQALQLSDAMLLREVRWRALFGLAQLQAGAKETSAALDSYRQALETIEGLRAEIRLDQLKDGFLGDKLDVYTGLIGLLVDLQRNDEAFAVAERSRARNLIDLLGRQRLSLAGSVDQELYDRQNRLKEQLLEQESLAAQATTPAERALYAAALEQLRAAYQDLLLEIEQQRPELLALVQVKPLSLEEIRALLEPGVVLLSYYQLPDRLLCWRIDHDRATLFIQSATADDVAEAITGYRRMLQNLEPLEARSRALYELLLAKPLAGVGSLRGLGIIPHASLHYLAFATLSDNRDYLIDRQPLFYLPTASVLRYTLARRQAEKNPRVLAIGNPDLGNPDFDLPFAEREVGTLRWNYPQVTTLTRERATESWVRAHINEFGIIHLASHGEFDPINPLFSAVRLTPDAQQDGRLQTEEIFGLDISADLVVLSACQTGLGDLRKGDDVVGMNRAFLFAGTHALISSLWRVSDVSTAMLMKQFYRDYTRNNKAESLRRAMLHVKQRYPHPGYWGAFVLTGDYL